MKFKHTISQSAKEDNNFAWYKHFIDQYCNRGVSGVLIDPDRDPGLWGAFDDDAVRNKAKINYDLFNNILNIDDMRKSTAVISLTDEIPEDMTNKDIFSPKIKALMGMLDDRTFQWRIYPLNREATTRIEEAKIKKFRQYVEAQVMQPIIEEQIAKLRMSNENTPSGTGAKSQEEIQQELQKLIDENKPESIHKYMNRKHSDPVQVLSSQLLNYGMQKYFIKDKTRAGWKHALLSGKEAYLLQRGPDGIVPYVLDPCNLNYDVSQDEDSIEDGEWASYTFYLSPSRVLAMYGNVLSKTEKETILSHNDNTSNSDQDLFQTRPNFYDGGSNIAVTYVCFRSLMKIGFLKYVDQETGNILETLVNDSYVLNELSGDIDIEWEWVPQIHHGTRIHAKGDPIYVNMEPLPFDTSVEGSLYDLKLPIVGGVYDNTNSISTSIGDRLRVYQYQYDAVMWKIEKLMASDKGKKLMMDSKMISGGDNDIATLYEYISTLDLIPVTASKEGNNRANSANTMKDRVDMVDLSLASDIAKYIEIAEFIKRSASEAIGLPRDMEGQQSQYKSGVAVDQTISSASNIIEPYFRMHNTIVRNMLNVYLNATISYYAENPTEEKLAYILDDMSMDILTIDPVYVKEAQVSLHVENSGKAYKIKNLIETLGQVAVNSQKAELSDIIRIHEEQDYVSAREILAQSEEKMHQRQRELNEELEKIKAQENERVHEREMEKLQFERETDLMVQDKKNEADLYRQAILATGFDKEADRNNDGVRDSVEIMNEGLERLKLSVDLKKHKDDVKLKERELDIKEKDVRSKNNKK